MCAVAGSALQRIPGLPTDGPGGGAIRSSRVVRRPKEDKQRRVRGESPRAAERGLEKPSPDSYGPKAMLRRPIHASRTADLPCLPLDQLEDLAIASSAWKKVLPFLLPKEETAVGRPIIPLHGGHVGLLSTAGLLNGVFGQGDDRHIARWRTVKYVTTFKVKDDDYTEVRKQERFSNEVALVYEDGRTSVLTDKKKGDEDAERASEARAA